MSINTTTKSHTGRRIALSLCLVIVMSLASHAQQQLPPPGYRIDSTHIVKPGHTFPLAVRNNLLYDAFLTPNLGVDWRLSRRWSIGLTAGYRPWPTSDDTSRKWRHVLIMPELRHWSDSTFADRSWFWGVNAVYSHFNVADVDFPIGTLYSAVKDERRQGDLVAVGASVGRSWRLCRWLRIEAEAGLDVGYALGDSYRCGRCGMKVGDFSGPFLMPKLALNLVLHPQPTQPQYAVVPIQPAEPVEPVKPHFVIHPVADFSGQAGILQRDNPVLEHISQYRPYDRTRILRKEKGALYVHFPLDKSELSSDYRDNAGVLDRIVDITRQILADSTSNVCRIQIIGLASVEGAVTHNEELAAQRAEALKAYIQQQVATPDTLYELCNGGEAWTELRDQINDVVIAPGTHSDSEVQALRQAIAIIDSEADLSRREQRLRTIDGGSTYRYIREQLLPDQRNSGYLRIYYDYVPDTRAASINSGTQLLAEGRYQEALAKLSEVRDDPRGWNALAVALWYCDRHDEAITYFRRAADNGNHDARENLRQITR
ncbi:MAG: DUF3575 domain-containing protein [Prevotella sp.]|nr:DUF3575 domain-containing protein [Prevotella sp.]